ncbi:sulfatase-like hydrolase/transferase [Armatimonas sp.]|uniref:sulfatase-like hydrolase/transferase n=1 Tax=Armatimonas sp. TaxID=1872638 RepID=UPI00286B731C|nr:sulfatase-like hydrolase/transferase [Armatimonas sp.]
MNLILFNPDEFRAESAHCYGHPLAPTPNLDRLAAEGTRFDQCHVQHPVCTPSRCSFMTGWYPHVRGHRTLWHTLQPDEPNLLRYLKQAGYEVVWGGKNDLLSPESFASSVDDWKLDKRSTRAIRGVPTSRNPWSQYDDRFASFLYEPTDAPLEALGDFAKVDGAIEYLKSGPTQPFCLYLPLLFPHCPYVAPQPWHDLIDPDALPALRPVRGDGAPDFHKMIRQTRKLDRLDESVLRKINAVYLGMIGVVDHLLGMLLDTLEQTGLADDTAIVFFSDHGDWAGDYGLVEKWPSALDDTITRVPLVIKIPGGKRGHVVTEPVELFDIFATALELTGTEARHTHFARSLVPQLQGAAGDPNRVVFAEGGYAFHEPLCFEGRQNEAIFRDTTHIYYPKGRLQQDYPESVCRAAMVRTQTHKLIRRPDGTSELYDLVADPQELRNLYGQQLDIQAALERRLLDWYLQTADVTPHTEWPRGFPV